jgi:hypothetical protein
LFRTLVRAGEVEWVVEVSRTAPNPMELLGPLADDGAVPLAQREALYRRIIEGAEQQLAKSFGEARGQALATLAQWQMNYANYLLKSKQIDRAQAVLQAMTPAARESAAQQLARLEAALAIRAGRLSAVLEGHRRNPDSLSSGTMVEAANDLRETGDAAPARALLQVVYEEELEKQGPARGAANLLGLAELKLEDKDVPSAMAYLRRMALVADDPVTQLFSAAQLLRRSGRDAEAQEFLLTRAKLAPWDAGAQVALDDPKVLAAIVTSPAAEYSARVAAARKLKASASPAGSAELDAIASGRLDPANVEKPYFVAARVDAAAVAKDPAVRLRLLQGALSYEPNAQGARVPLLQAALAAKRPQLAVSALGAFGSRWIAPKAGLTTLLEQSGLTTALRAEVWSSMSDAYAQLENWPMAIEFLNEVPNAPAARMHDLQMAQWRESANGARRPVIQKALEQTRIVKPMVTRESAQ